MSRDTFGRFEKGSSNDRQILPVYGEVFGDLVVDSLETRRTNDNRPMWLFKCTCGEHQWIPAREVRRAKNPRTCCSFCSRSEAGKKRMSNPSTWKKVGKHSGVGDLTLTHVCSLKANATKRNIEWALSADYLWDLLVKSNHKCALSGLDISLGKLLDSKVDYHMKTASLDRIDNSKGYVKGNVQWLHKHVNIMKNIHSEDYFISLCSLISNKSLEII
jgi:hypothetical protein